MPETTEEKWWVLQKSLSIGEIVTSVEVFAGPFNTEQEAEEKCLSDYPGFRYEVVSGPINDYLKSNNRT